MRGRLSSLADAVRQRWAATSEEKYVQLQIASSKWTRQREDFHGLIRDTLREFYAYLPGSSARILDAGCGDGWALDQMRRDGYRQVEGVDVNPDKLDVARASGNLVHRQNLHELSLDEASYDAVYSRHTLEHVLKIDRALTAFYRILRPGGVFFLVVPKTTRHGPHFQQFLRVDEVSAIVKRAGFDIVRQEGYQKLEFEFWVVGVKPA